MVVEHDETLAWLRSCRAELRNTQQTVRELQKELSAAREQIRDLEAKVRLLEFRR